MSAYGHPPGQPYGDMQQRGQHYAGSVQPALAPFAPVLPATFDHQRPYPAPGSARSLYGAQHGLGPSPSSLSAPPSLPYAASASPSLYATHLPPPAQHLPPSPGLPRAASSFAAPPPPPAPPPLNVHARRWSDFPTSPTAASSFTDRTRALPNPRSLLPPPLPPLPSVPRPPPVPPSPFPHLASSPSLRRPQLDPASPASAASPAEALARGEDEELARVLELSRASHALEQRSRGQRETGVWTSAAGEDEDVLLAKALEESLLTARARSPGPAVPDWTTDSEALAAPLPSSPSAVPSPTTSLLSPTSSDPGWGFVVRPASRPDPSVARRATYAPSSTAYTPPLRSASFSSTPAPASAAFYNGTVQQRHQAGPPPSPSAALHRRQSEVPFVVHEAKEDDSGLMHDVEPAEEEEAWHRPSLEQGSHSLEAEGAHWAPRSTTPNGSVGSDLYSLSTGDMSSTCTDGGLVWGKTTLDPPALTPLSVQHGLALPHHTTGAVYIIAPEYADLLTGLFALAGVLVEGGEETRLAVQFIRVDDDDDESVTILWVESGRLAQELAGEAPAAPVATSRGERPPLRMRTTTASSTSSSGSGATSSRSLSGKSVLRKRPKDASSRPLSDSLIPICRTPVASEPPATSIYSSSFLIFQHPSFLAYDPARPELPPPQRRSALVALPPPGGPVLSLADLLRHLLSLTPSALSDALSLSSAAPDLGRPASFSASSTTAQPTASTWSGRDKERFLALVAAHTANPAREVAYLKDSDDSPSAGAGGGKGAAAGEKERSKRRWIKEHLKSAAGVNGSGGAGEGGGKKHSTARLSKERKDQVAEVAAFITPFSFPTGEHT